MSERKLTDPRTKFYNQKFSIRNRIHPHCRAKWTLSLIQAKNHIKDTTDWKDVTPWLLVEIPVSDEQQQLPLPEKGRT